MSIEYDIAIKGMTCASCVARVERKLKKVESVQSANVNLATERARIIAAENIEPKLRRAIRDAGYTPVITDGAQAKQSNQAQLWDGFLPIAVAILLCLPMVFPMLFQPFGVHWMPPAWAQFLLATLVQFIFGARFYRAGWNAIKAGAGNMDLLVAIGTSAAYGLSIWIWGKAIAESGDIFVPVLHLYFEASSVVIALVRLGKWLETRAKSRAISAMNALQQLRPDIAHWVDGTEEVDIPIDELTVGDFIAVRSGERIPADGKVLEGHSEVNESMLTGEPRPVFKEQGSSITAGSLNGQGRLLVKVTAVGAQTTLAKIIRLVEDAQAAKAPIQRIVDKVAAVFVPIVLLIAVGTFILWLLNGAAVEFALISAVSVLVIACPCALGLATPVAIMAGTGVGARHGILIRDAQALELAYRTRCIAFDKTGTLTQGKPQLVQLIPLAPNGEPISQQENSSEAVEIERSLLAIAAGLQAGSTHPLAHAVLQATKEKGITAKASSDSQSIIGRGVTAQVEGRQWSLASLSWCEELGLPLQAISHVVLELSAGASVSVLLEDAKTGGDLPQKLPVLRALFIFVDTPREESFDALAALKNQHIELAMISGDRLDSALALAQKVGIEKQNVFAPVLPADKAACIAQLKGQKEGQSQRVVAMVGDGVNDAPALAAADVSVAMAAGSDVAMETASITLMRDDLRLLPAALDLSHKTVIKIRQNLFWAFIYNIIGIPFAAFGFLSPAVAGGAMAASSICVIANALLLTYWKPRF